MLKPSVVLLLLSPLLPIPALTFPPSLPQHLLQKLTPVFLTGQVSPCLRTTVIVFLLFGVVEPT